MASPPSSNFGSSKVCLVSSCLGHRGDDYRIYIVDLFEKNSSGSHRSANICVPLSLGVMSFCVFGSKLFMFEPAPGGGDLLPDPYQGRRVRTYEIPETPVFNLKLKVKDVVEAPYLNHSRLGTVGIPTPDGTKLLVFARCIWQWKDGNCLDFELYDPAIGSWQTLPGISSTWKIGGGQGIMVTAFCYIKNVLSLQTNRGVFVLDMEHPDRMLKNLPYDLPIPAPPVAEADGYFIAVHTHDLYLTPSVAQDTGRGIVLEYPGLSPLRWRKSRSIMLHQNNNNNEIKFCISHIGYSSGTSSHPHLILNLYRLDLDKYTKEMNKMNEGKMKEGRRYLPGTTLMRRSFDFRLEGHSTDIVSRMLNLYALP